MDANKNGLIEFDEFFDVGELWGNPTAQRIITMYDKNGDGKISFYEFVWGLSAFTNNANIEEKLTFAFQIYYMNNDGYLLRFISLFKDVSRW